MNSFTRHPKTETTEGHANADNHQVEDGQRNLLRRRKVLAPVHEQPEDTAQSEGEPAGEQGSLERQFSMTLIGGVK